MAVISSLFWYDDITDNFKRFAVVISVRVSIERTCTWLKRNSRDRFRRWTFRVWRSFYHYSRLLEYGHWCWLETPEGNRIPKLIGNKMSAGSFVFFTRTHERRICNGTRVATLKINVNGVSTRPRRTYGNSKITNAVRTLRARFVIIV